MNYAQSRRGLRLSVFTQRPEVITNPSSLERNSVLQQRSTWTSYVHVWLAKLYRYIETHEHSILHNKMGHDFSTLVFSRCYDAQ
jgi:hypothetical protein